MLRKKIKKYISNFWGAVKQNDRQEGKGFRVIVYHSVTDFFVKDDWQEETTPKEVFRQQLRYLKENNYRVLRCEEMIRCIYSGRDLPPKSLGISFDDGYLDSYINAFALLKEFGFPATIFVTLDFLRDYSGNPHALSCSELSEMKQSGLIDFGCHGQSHIPLISIGTDALIKEVKTAKQRLEGIINDKIFLFAYPFGHNRSYNKETVKVVQEAGFIAAFTSLFGFNDRKKNPFELRRNRVSWFDDKEEFRKNLSRAYDWYALCQRLGRKKKNISLSSKLASSNPGL